MSIRINTEKCIGCGRGTEICPGTLIDLQEKKAVMRYPKDCWGCASCVKECPTGGIEFFLGADIGGNGSIMNATREGGIWHWSIRKTDGTETTIDVNPKNSNKY